MRRSVLLAAALAAALLCSCFMPQKIDDSAIDNPFSGRFLTDSGQPASSLGSNGDLYLDTATATVYVKLKGSWTGVSTLKGADGSQWLSGSGAPTQGLGADGDMYLDSAASQIYRKASGAWQSLVGLTGSDGATWLSGSGEPSGSAGADGDYYLDTGTTAVWKRVSGSWTKTIAKLRSGSGDAAELATLTIDSGELWPPFSPAVLAYRAVLPAGASLVPALSGTAKTAGATVTPTQATALSGAESARTATLKVDATDPDTGTACTLTYRVVFQVPEAAVAWRQKSMRWYNWNSSIQRLVLGYTDTWLYRSPGGKAYARMRTYPSSSTVMQYDIIRDSKGRSVRRENWTINVSPPVFSGHRTYAYDTDDNLNSRVDYYSPLGAKTSYELYERDSSRRVTKYSSYNVGSPDALSSRTITTYDANGLENGGSLVNGEGSYTLSFVHSSGRKEQRYLSGTELVGKDVYTYDSAGNELSCEYFWKENGILMPTGGGYVNEWEAYTPDAGPFLSNEAALDSISLATGGPGVSWDKPLAIGSFEYTVTIAGSVSAVTLSAAPKDTNATLWHDSLQFAGMKNISLTAGATNVAWIFVKAQDGETIVPYKLNIIVP